MQIFNSVLTQILSLFAMIVIGYILYKTNCVPKNTDTVLSRILSYVAMPALSFSTLSENLSISTISQKWALLVLGLATVIFSYVVAILITPLFSKDSFLKHIYRYSFTIANLSYMGFSLIEGVFGSAKLADMLIFVIPFNIFIYTIGYPTLTGSNKISFKALFNPAFIGLALGAVVGICGIKMPIINNIASSLGACMGPAAMLLTGFVVAQYNLVSLIKNVKVIFASAVRLLVIPSIIALALKLCGMPRDILIIALCTTAMPLGLNTVVFPASCGKDTQTGASMALISNVMGVITIPIMFLIFI